MGDYHTYYERKPGETTQFEDQLIKHGIIEAPEPAWKPEKFTPQEDVDRNSRAYVDSASARELEENDEYVDDRFMEEYRRKRLEQLKAEASQKKEISVPRISRDQFVERVTFASQQGWVVCHLLKDHIVACMVMQDSLLKLAHRFPSTQFVEIISTDCIPNFPDGNLPTLLVYHKGKCVKTLAGAVQFGGLPTPESECPFFELSFLRDIC